jgi:peptidoglycan hydrolase CwlO-like protein
MTTPNVVWYVDPTGACMIFMHAGNIVRSSAAANVHVAQRTIASVAISEFDMPQPEAEALAERSVQAQTAAVALPKTLSDHVTLLQEQMADHDAQLTQVTAEKLKAESDLRLAQSDIATLTKANETLTAELAAAKVAAEPPPVTSVTSVTFSSTSAASGSTEQNHEAPVHSGGTASGTVA